MYYRKQTGQGAALKESYNRDIPVPHSTYLVYFRYDDAAEILILALKSGKEYQVSGVNKAKANALLKSQNRGSFIAQNFLKNDKFQCVFVQNLPPERLNFAPPNSSKNRWLAR